MLSTAHALLNPAAATRAEITPRIEQDDSGQVATGGSVELIHQLLDSVGGYAGGTSFVSRGRGTMARYSVLYRCIDLLANVAAGLETQIRDEDG